MLDHLLFNKLKWWNVNDSDQQITANNKKYYAIPNQIVIKANTYFQYYLPQENWYRNFTTTHDETVNVVGISAKGYFISGELKDLATVGGSTLSNIDSLSFVEDNPLFVSSGNVKSVVWGG